MKKIIITLIAVSTLSFTFAEDASTTVMTGGNEKMGQQVKALIQERDAKIKAIQLEYQVKIKAIMDLNKIKNATSSERMASSTEKMKEMMKEMKKSEGKELFASSTIEKMKEKMKMKGEVKGAATTTVDAGSWLFDFFSGFFKK